MTEIFNFTDEQVARLKAVGEIQKLGNVENDEEWLNKAKGYDVICTWGDHVMANLDILENVLVTYPYTELGSFNSDNLAKKMST